jgi:hypothetical protein
MSLAVVARLFPQHAVNRYRAGADLRGAADFDLELIEHRTLDGHIKELVYRAALHA